MVVLSCNIPEQYKVGSLNCNGIRLAFIDRSVLPYFACLIPMLLIMCGPVQMIGV